MADKDTIIKALVDECDRTRQAIAAHLNISYGGRATAGRSVLLAAFEKLTAAVKLAKEPAEEAKPTLPDPLSPIDITVADAKEMLRDAGGDLIERILITREYQVQVIWKHAPGKDEYPMWTQGTQLKQAVAGALDVMAVRLRRGGK